jgi:hypothetical protein
MPQLTQITLYHLSVDEGMLLYKQPQNLKLWSARAKGILDSTFAEEARVILSGKTPAELKHMYSAILNGAFVLVDKYDHFKVEGLAGGTWYLNQDFD